MSDDGHHLLPPPPGDAHDLVDRFAPSLLRLCERRLGPIEWFRTAHQRGGAATGFSTWHTPTHVIPVLVKLPLQRGEARWTTGLGRCDVVAWNERWSLSLPTPRVVASGDGLDGYHVPWVIEERLAGPSLSDAFDEQAALDLLRAAADFQAAAMKVAPLERPPPGPDWEHAIAHAKQLARANAFPNSHTWTDLLKRVLRALPLLVRRWEARGINAWCHGDLHPGNALRRAMPPGTTDPSGRNACVLVDLDLVHSGHWAEDALYLERQFWGHERAINGLKPVPTLARLRRERGLPADDNYGDLAMVRRVLMAAAAPTMIDREGSPAYLVAAHDILARCLPQAAR